MWIGIFLWANVSWEKSLNSECKYFNSNAFLKIASVTSHVSCLSVLEEVTNSQSVDFPLKKTKERKELKLEPTGVSDKSITA